ncbi:MAG: RidA family protein [Rhodothermales bacterium]|nr:RidA family protein [Rhodothermales bacterium]
MRIVSTNDAPSPAGHYSQGVQSRGLLFVSGQLPVDPQTRKLVNASIEEETIRTLTNVRQIVEASGSTLQDIVKVTIYVTDIEHWPRINEAYADFFGEHRPARAVVPVGPLHHGARIEIEAVAACNEMSA